MYKIIKNALSLDECEFIFSEFEKIDKQKDWLVEDSDIVHKSELSDIYSEKLKIYVEEFYSTKLNTTLGYTRKSFKGQKLFKHKDVCEFVMSVLIKQSDTIISPLYLWIDGEKNEIVLEQGDAVIFEGSKIFHERDTLLSDWLVVMILAYERVRQSKLM
jgi:hypothetical protein